MQSLIGDLSSSVVNGSFVGDNSKRFKGINLSSIFILLFIFWYKSFDIESSVNSLSKSDFRINFSSCVNIF